MQTGLRDAILNITLFLLLILIRLIGLSTSTPTGTLTQNQSIADGDVLVSAGENYALGFFSPGNSDRRYVGIWFNKVSERTVVWVANRNNPLTDTSGVVSFNEDGTNLVLTSTKTNTATPLCSANASPTANNVGNFPVMAELLDSGNLVVIQKGTERVLWQSFDYPTDTFLPFMKFGLDRGTGLNRVLTSRISNDDPGTGPYWYGIDTAGVPQLFMFKGSDPRWRAGPWNGLRWSGVPEMSDRVILNASYVDSPDEIRFTRGTVYDGSSVFSRFVMDESGFGQLLTWDEEQRRWFRFWSAPGDICDSYGRCGAYSYCDPNPNWDLTRFECKCLPGFKPRSPKDRKSRYESRGCTRERGVSSACGGGEGFVKVEKVKLPDTRVARVDVGLTGEACERECLSNCSCVAYTSANVSGDGTGTGCLAWYGDLMDIKILPGRGQDLYVRVDAVELANARKRSSKGFQGAKRTIVIATVPTIFVALLLVFLQYCSGKRLSRLRGHARQRSDHALLLNISPSHRNAMDENECEGSDNTISLPFFSLREIRSATNNFSNKLGEGGFGTVYNGQLPDGQEVAVKRLSKHSRQGVEEFKNEILSIAKLQHRNLVKILGCCMDEEETMLIYEYMPNKSLDFFIFDQSRKAKLFWRRRYDIIIGIVRGMIYLHQDSRLRVVHRDLKASNILLDADMNPKISDFGMARIFGRNQTQANTKRVVGTFGYMSPEYALDGVFSMKSDVFSFGVLLLEIITGKKNRGFYNDDPLSNLIIHIWDLWNEDRALEIIDSSMNDSLQESDVLRCIHVGLLCVQETAAERPTMFEVLFMLNSETTLPSPRKPPSAVRRSCGDIAGAAGSNPSKNEVTISMVEPR